MKKFILPVLLTVISAGAAFASSTLKNSESTLEKGYKISADPMQPCVESNRTCSTVPTPNICKESGVTLYELNGSSCGDHLFEP